jgi:hypothetical protein
MTVTVIDDTSVVDGSNWQTFNGDGSVAVGSGEVVKPDVASPLSASANFLNVTLDAAGTQFTAHTPAPNFVVNTTDVFGMWVYIPTFEILDRALTVGGGITLGLHQTNIFTDYATINPAGLGEIGIGWNLFVFQTTDLTTFGTWSDTGTVTDITVRFDWSSGSPGADQSVFIGPIMQGLQDQANGAYRVIFRNDDGLRNPWIIGYPMITSRGFPQSASCIPYENIGAGPTVFSDGEVSSAQRSGSPILNHGTDSLSSANFPTTDLITADVSAGNSRLAQWNEGPKIFVYPEGIIGDATYNGTEVLDAVKAAGQNAALRTGGYGSYTGRDVPDDGFARFNFPAIFTDATSSAAYIAKLDKAKRLRQTVVVGFHSLVPSGATGTETNIPDFVAILDDIKTDALAGDVQLMDIYELMGHIGAFTLPIGSSAGVIRQPNGIRR